MSYHLWVWIVFNSFILLMLLCDLLVFHRKSHEVRTKEALDFPCFSRQVLAKSLK